MEMNSKFFEIDFLLSNHFYLLPISNNVIMKSWLSTNGTLNKVVLPIKSNKQKKKIEPDTEF